MPSFLAPIRVAAPLRALALAVLVAAASFCRPPLQAQPRGPAGTAIRIEPGLLEGALAQVRRGGLDVVYTRALVAGLRTACRYEGSDASAALACAVAGTGLEAVRVGPRQVALRRVVPAQAVPVTLPAARAPAPRIRRVTMAGFVLDAASGEVLPGATVSLPDLRRGAQASSAGYFVVPSVEDGRHRVRATYVGYEPLDTVLAAGQTRAVLRLRPTRIEVREVVVERGRASAAPGPGTTELSAAELDLLPAPLGEQDLLRKLEWLPGVSRAGAAAGGLLVRGGEPDENLYLLDDAPVYHPWHAFTLVSTFQAETVSQVRLYRGIFPAEHGGRLSSVVETELRDGNQEAPSLTAGVGVLAARYLLETPITRGASLMVSARRSYVDKLIGDRHPVENGALRDTLRTAYYFADLNVKATIRPGFRHRLSASVYQGGDRLDVRLPFDTPLDLGSLLRPSRIAPSDLVFDVDHTWGNRLVSVRHQYLASARVFTTATAYVTSYEARERTLLRPAQSASIRADYGVRLSETGLRLTANAALTPHLTATFGFQGALRRFRSLLFSTTTGTFAADAGTEPLQRLDVDGTEGVLYGQIRASPSERVDVQGGLRATALGPGGYRYVLPNVSAQWRVVPGRAVVRAGAGAAVQSMQRLRDRTSLLYDLVAERWIPASRQVPPAVGVQVAAGGEVRVGPAAVVGVEVYRRQSRDVLLPSDDPLVKDALGGAGIDLAALLGQYVRADARAIGLEASLQGQRGRWRYLAAYTAERTERRIVGRSRYGVARYDVPHRLEANVERRLGAAIVAGLSGEVRTGFPEAVPVARYRVGDGLDDSEAPTYLERPATLNGRLPAYGRIDATVRLPFRMLDVRWQATLQIYNLLTYRNVFERVYTPTETGLQVTPRRGLPLLPLFELSATL